MSVIKYAIICLSILFLTGCFYQTTSKFDIDRAENICGKDGVVEIEIFFAGTGKALCRNGTYTFLSEAKL